MEYENIKQLIDDMGNSRLTSINIEFPDGVKISMKKETEEKIVIKESKLEPNSNKHTTTEEKKVSEEDVNIVKSPMVGTFYIKPSPTSNPYIEIGKEVKEGDTLCIIEAMKLMNEIESEYSGKVKEILVNDGDTVEYGTPLLIIE